MKKIIFLSIFAAILLVCNLNQAYALKATVTIYGKGGGSGSTSGGVIKICPEKDSDKCATIVIDLPESAADIVNNSDISLETSVTPIYWDNCSVLLMSDETGDIIEGRVLDIKVFDATKSNIVSSRSLPSLSNSVEIDPGSVTLTPNN